MRTGIVVVALAATAGCATKLEGPSPAPRSLTPGVVCVEQLTTPVTLSGAGFAGLVEGALGESPRLVLPEVTLVRSSDAEGRSAAPFSRRIPDSPADVPSGGLTWADPNTLAFSITPALALEPGVYDVQVRNPVNAAVTTRGALLALPRPSITRVVPTAMCTEGGGEVRVEGDFFVRSTDALPDVTIGGQVLPAATGDCRALAGGTLQTCRQLTVQVPAGLLAAGFADVVVRNPDPAACASTDQASGAAKIEVVPPPTLVAVSPQRLCAEGGSLTFTGTGFRPGASLSLGGTAAQTVEVTSDTSLTATFGLGLEPGQRLAASITTVAQCSATLPEAVEVLPSPQLFFVDPPVTYQGIATQLSAWGSGLAENLTVTLRKGDSRRALVSHFDPLHPTRLRLDLPAGLDAGTYSLEVTNDLGCTAALADALRVVDTVNVAIDRVEPAFGWTSTTTGITVLATVPKPAGTFGFQAVPGAWLTRSGGGGTQAEPLQAVTVLDEGRLTAVVPAGLAPGDYDLVLVNPDGSLGVKSAAFRATALKPPTIAGLTPSSLPNDGPHSLTVRGSDFRQPAVSLTCRSADGSTTSAAFQQTGFSVVQVTGTVNTKLLPAPAACVVRVTNGDDGSWVDFSALVVTNPAQNLTSPKAGPSLVLPRRAPSLAAVRVNGAARYLVAAGGDDGTEAGARDTVESNAIDLFGEQGPAWRVQRYPMLSRRSLAGTVAIGRFVYAIGGTDGTTAVDSAERAALLDPLFRPEVAEVELRVGREGEPGVTPGVWYYRVAAVLGPDDPFNPEGETLASERFPLSLPALQPARGFQVTLQWSELPGALEYRIYRSPEANAPAGRERLIATVPASAGRAWTDDGRTPVAPDEETSRPLPLGSLGRWHPIPSLNVARKGAATAVLPDREATNGWWIYVMGGFDARGAALTSIERLPVGMASDGSQAALGWIVDARSLSRARGQLGAFVGSSASTERIPSGKAYVWAGPGRDAGGGNVNVLEAAQMLPDGSLGAFQGVDSPANYVGYGSVLAGNFLYMFGGGGPADTSARQGEICDPSVGGCQGSAAPALRNWNTATSSAQPRHLAGTALESATIYLVGGVGPSGTGATATTEQLIW